MANYLFQITKTFLVSALFVSVAIGAPNAATASSDGTFKLAGNEMTASQGVKSWPVKSGSVVEALATPVTVSVSSGCKLVLKPNSTASVVQKGEKTSISMLKGSASYELPERCGVSLLAQGKPYVLTAAAGELSVVGSAVGVAGAAGAAGVGAAKAAGIAVGVASAAGGTAVAVAKATDDEPAPVSQR